MRACLRPSMMPGPGTRCALVSSAQSAILYRPPPYCATTVLPMSANLRSSKIMKSAWPPRTHHVSPRLAPDGASKPTSSGLGGAPDVAVRQTAVGFT